MPIILNNNPNPQAVMLNGQHLSKIMLGGDVVWQKHRPKPPEQGVTLESLEYQKVKLKAANQNGNLYFPMFFPDRLRDDYQTYLDRLTFVGKAVVSLQTIDAMLIADVVENEIFFPMFFFDQKPNDGEFDFRKNCTFIANEPPEPDEVIDFVKDFSINVIDPEVDYTQDFEIDVLDPATDFIKEFTINVIDPAQDFVKDFTIPVVGTVDFTKDFSIPVIIAKDFIKDFTIPVLPATKYSKTGIIWVRHEYVYIVMGRLPAEIKLTLLNCPAAYKNDPVLKYSLEDFPVSDAHWYIDKQNVRQDIINRIGATTFVEKDVSSRADWTAHVIDITRELGQIEFLVIVNYPVPMIV